MRRLIFALVFPLMAGSALLGGCSKDPPPKPSDEPKKATPVPSDMVFNDFVPPGGGSSGIVGVKTDGGLPEGGMAAADGGGADEAAAVEDPTKLNVTEPGAEPRTPRKYAFVANRSDKRLVNIRQSAGREGQAAGQEASFAVTLDFVPKQVKPTGTRFELKVLNVEMPDLPAAQKAQAAVQLGVFKGLAGGFDVSPRGEVGEVDFKADERMGGPAAEMIMQSLQQALELIVPPLPVDPVGVGAKWERKVERKERGQASVSKHVFTLKEASDEGGVIIADVEISVPKHPLQQRGLPPGATEEVSGKGSYTYTFKFDHIASKVEGDMSITRKVELGKQSEVTVVKLKNRIEPAK